MKLISHDRFTILITAAFVMLILTACQALISVPESSGVQQLVVYATSDSAATLPPINTPTITNTPAEKTPYATMALPTPTETPPIIGIGSMPSGVNPFTGLKVDEPLILDRRPLMVKVSNYPRFGRPHAGLSSADIVFDYFIGYGENRFVALYYTNHEEVVGPMRSGRLVDGQLGRLYQSIIFYRNADPDVNEGILEKLGDRAVWDAACPPICNIGEYSSASSFGNTYQMEAYIDAVGIDNARPSITGMLFDPRKMMEGKTVEKIGIQFGEEDRAEWHYNVSTGKYERWIEASASQPFTMIPLVDRNNGEQITVDNLIVMFADYIEYKPTMHDINLWGNKGGETAYLFRDGRMKEGSWRVVNKDKPIHFYDENGGFYTLKPGNTWIVILDIDSTINEIDPETWDFYFELGEG